MFKHYTSYNVKTSTYYTLLITIIVAFAVAHIIFVFTTRFTKTITVLKKYTSLEDHSTTKYMDIEVKYNVIARDGEVFSVVDSLWLWSWNKVSTWDKLTPGKTYKIEGYGYSVNMLNWHPNIVRIQEV